MKITCNHCGSKNEPGCAYCYNCGKEIDATIMDLYPEYHFVPASLKKVPGKFWSVRLLWLFPLFGIIGAILWPSFYYVVFPDWLHICGDEKDLICILFAFIYVYSALLICHKNPKPVFLTAIADYIQDANTSENYLFIVKDKKFGLYNQKKRKIQIEAKYDCLSWKQKDMILSAMKDGKSLTIDINNNALT